MHEIACKHCGRPVDDPEEPYCCAECLALGFLSSSEPIAMLGIRRLAELEREASASKALAGNESISQARVRMLYQTESGTNRACGNCKQAMQWVEHGSAFLDCRLHGQTSTPTQTAAFAWRDLFIAEGLSDDGDALYCRCFEQGRQVGQSRQPNHG